MDSLKSSTLNTPFVFFANSFSKFNLKKNYNLYIYIYIYIRGKEGSSIISTPTNMCTCQVYQS